MKLSCKTLQKSLTKKVLFKFASGCSDLSNVTVEYNVDSNDTTCQSTLLQSNNSICIFFYGCDSIEVEDNYLWIILIVLSVIVTVVIIIIILAATIPKIDTCLFPYSARAVARKKMKQENNFIKDRETL